MWNKSPTLVCDSFKAKQVTEWDGNDCYNFATTILEGLDIAQGVWLNKDAFHYMLGKDILTNKRKDYVNILGEEYGSKFYKVVDMYLKSRKYKGKSKAKLGKSFPKGHFYECANWTVPQSQLCVEEIYANQCLSQISYSYAPACITNHVLRDAHYFPYQNYRESNYFTEMPLPDDDFGMGACSISHSDHTDKHCPDDNPMACSFADGSNNFPGEHLDLGIKDITEGEEIDTEGIDWDVEPSELDIYLPDENTLPNYTHPMDGIPCASGSGTVAFCTESSSPLDKIVAGKRNNRTRNPKSWEFLVRLLIDTKTNPSLIKWEDKDEGTFRLVDKDEIARLWGSRTEKRKDEALSYDNFARNLRYHYKHSGMLEAVSEKHLVYKLGAPVIKVLKQKNQL